jgi:hypothetical protein
MITFTRSWQFSQGDIYRPQGRWPNIWGLDEPLPESHGFRGVNPKNLATADPGGILSKISPFENRHALFTTVMITLYC